MIDRLLCVLLGALLLLASPPAAAQHPSLEGSWALVSRDTIIFRFDLERLDNGEWSGTWLRPDSFGSNGEVFVQVQGPIERIVSMAGLDFAGLVEVSFPDPRPNAVPDIFSFRLVDADHAEMTYVGTELAPYPMVRVTPADMPGPWEIETVYHRPGREPVNLRQENRSAEAELPNDDAELPDEPEPAQSRIGADFLDGL